MLVLAALRVPLPAVGAAAGVRGWMWSGGLLGAFYITAALVLAPRLGAGSFIAAVVAGQMLAALAADRFGGRVCRARTERCAHWAGPCWWCWGWR